MSLQQRFDAPVDAIALRSDGVVVACTSNVFGNTWDGGIVAIAPGQFGQSKGFQKVPTPSGCTDVAFVGSAGTAIAVSCDDGNVAIYNLNGHGINGVPVKLFTDHENSVTSVSTSVVQPGNLLSASMDCTIVQYSTDGTDSSSVHEFKGARPQIPQPSVGTGSRALRPRPGHHGAVWDVEYSDTSPSSFASAGQDGAVKLWDERGKACTATLPHASPLFCVAWLPGPAPLLAAAGEEGDILVYDLRSPQVRPRPALAPRPRRLSSPRRVAAAGRRRRLP
jgi:WD40 repeat protein